MKRIIILLNILMLFSCENPIIEKIGETYPNKQPKQIDYYQTKDGKQVKVEEKTFYEDGKLKMEGEILNDKRDGEWKAYFDNGKLQSEGFFKEDKRTGISKVYYENGKLRYEGAYANDNKIGHWKFYNEQGKLVKEEDFN